MQACRYADMDRSISALGKTTVWVTDTSRTTGSWQYSAVCIHYASLLSYLSYISNRALSCDPRFLSPRRSRSSTSQGCAERPLGGKKLSEVGMKISYARRAFECRITAVLEVGATLRGYCLSIIACRSVVGRLPIHLNLELVPDRTAASEGFSDPVVNVGTRRLLITGFRTP